MSVHSNKLSYAPLGVWKNTQFSQWELKKSVYLWLSQSRRSRPSEAPAAQEEVIITRQTFKLKRSCDPPESSTIRTGSDLLEDVSQLLHVEVAVVLTIFPGREALVLLLHIRFPNMHKVGRLHHLQFAASTHQSPQRLCHRWLLPLQEAGAQYAETDLFALLKDAGQLSGTRYAGTG